VPHTPILRMGLERHKSLLAFAVIPSEPAANEHRAFIASPDGIRTKQLLQPRSFWPPLFRLTILNYMYIHVL
jgi:hypothetical protein